MGGGSEILKPSNDACMSKKHKFNVKKAFSRYYLSNTNISLCVLKQAQSSVKANFEAGKK